MRHDVIASRDRKDSAISFHTVSLTVRGGLAVLLLLAVFLWASFSAAADRDGTLSRCEAAFASPAASAAPSSLRRLSDIDLARRVVENRDAEEPSARDDPLGILFERHFPAMRHWNDDIRQDVAEKVVKSIDNGSFFSGDGSFSSWLNNIRRNVEHDARRRQIVREKAEQETAVMYRLLLAGTDPRTEQLSWLRERLSAMPVPLRKTAALVLFHGFTHAEAAARLGVKEGTIHWRMSTIVKRLKAERFDPVVGATTGN